MRNVNYCDHWLEIRVPTNDAETLHKEIIKALSGAMMLYMKLEVNSDKLALLHLLESILPDGEKIMQILS